MKFHFNIIILLFAALTSNLSFAQKPAAHFPQTNGDVKAIKKRGDTVFVGGNFTRVFTTDSTASFGAAVTAYGGVMGSWAKPNNTVYSSVNDGNGGVYIAGAFTMVGDSVRNHIAHLDSLGRVTAKFSGMGTDNDVLTIGVQGDTLFAGGHFRNAGNISSTISMIDTSGTTIKWAQKNIIGSAFCAIPDGIGGAYIAGYYTKIGDESVSRIVHIDSMGNLYPWFPRVGLANIKSIALGQGVVYIGGAFSTIDGQTRNNLAALDSATGSLLSWNPNPDSEVNSLTLWGSMLYVGGKFLNIGSASRKELAAISPVTGLANSWNPTLNGLAVTSLQVMGNTLFVCGDFTNINAQTRNTIASFDLTTGALNSWNPNATGGYVKKCFAYGSYVYSIGTFTSIGGQSRSGFAAVHINTGLANSWQPNVTGSVNYITAIGGFVYLSGFITKVSNQNRYSLASVDTITGTAGTWNPSVGSVPDLLISVGNRLLVLGPTGGGIFKPYLAAFRISTNTLLSWSPVPDLHVTSMAFMNNKLFVSGAFNYMGTSVRSGLASFDLPSGNLTTWNPNPNFTSAIYIKQILATGGNIYACGNFSVLGGASRNYLGCVDAQTGLATSWNPNPNGNVLSLCQYGSSVFAGGEFTSIGGSSRRFIASLNTSTGAATSWNLPVDTTVTAVSIINNKLYFGGRFALVDSQARARLAMADASTGSLSSWNPYSDNNDIHHITAMGNYVYVAGSSSLLGGQKQNHLMAFKESSGALLLFNPNPNKQITTIAVSDSILYAGGDFTSFGGVTRSYFASINITTNTVTSLDLNISGGSPTTLIKTIQLAGDTLYLGGRFSSIKGQLRYNLASFHKLTGALSTWNPGITGTVFSICITSDNIIVGGQISSINSQTRTDLGSFNLASKALLPWGPNVGGFGWVESVICLNQTVYFGGNFSTINGQLRNSIAAVDKSTGTLRNWYPDPYVTGTVYSLTAYKDQLYIGGRFGSHRNNVALVDTSSGLPFNWDPDVFKQDAAAIPALSNIGVVYTICPADPITYIGGVFERTGNYPVNQIAGLFGKPEITISNSGLSNYCPGAKGKLFFSSNRLMSTGNIFTLQLSDKNGSFINPVNVGSVNSLQHDSIPFTIPLNTLPGSNYTFRIWASSPYTFSVTGSPFTVFSKPNTGFTVNDSTQCYSGNAFNFSDTTSIVQNRIWYFGNGDSASVQSPVKTYTAANSYIVRMVATSLQGCKDSSSKTVVVYPQTLSGFSVNDSDQCKTGNSFIFTNTSSLSSGTFTNTWHFDNGDSSTQTSPSKSYTNPGAYTVKLVTNTNNGCKDSLIKTVIVHPQTNIGFTINDSGQCLIHNLFSFINNSSLSTGSFSSFWRLGNGDTSTQLNPTKTFAGAGSYIIQLTTTTNNGCKDTLIKPVVVFAHPAAVFATDSTKCFTGNSFVMSNTSSGSPTAYHWNFGNSTISTAQSPSVSYAAVGTYAIRLVAENMYKCTDTVTQNVRVKPNPAIPFVSYAPDTIVCDNVNIILKTNSSDTKSWLLGAVPLGASGDSLVVSNTAGAYSLKVTNSENCEATSSVVNLFFKPTPAKPIVSVLGNVFTSSATAGNQWYNTSGIIAGQTAQTFTATSIGQYYTIVTVNGCSSPASDLVNFPATGTNTPVTENGISVYPNPNNGSFTIVLNQKTNEPVLVKMFDLTGRLVLSEVKTGNELHMQAANLASGSYFVEVINNNEVKRVRLTINR